ncbi:MAG: peroxiredoxin [Caulobacteraceae bacterium]|jgi:organic hydroperoxide reductase OsmC/OhrA|nr:peroxiredoxin [Caulobacteraceae bacterium]
MSLYHATVRWTANGDFASGHYGRDHEVIFDGLTVRGSASQGKVPAGTASADAVDPEEMFVASLAQCHMLWFIDLARQANITVHSYEDAAEGVLGKNVEGLTAMTSVTLRPKVASTATLGQLTALHHKAHAVCFIANSVRTKVIVEMRT